MLTHLFRTRTCFYSLSCLTFKLMRQFNDPLSFMSKEPKWLIVDLRSSCGLLATRENMLIYRRHKVLVVVIILVLILNFVNVSRHKDLEHILKQNIDSWMIEIYRNKYMLQTITIFTITFAIDCYNQCIDATITIIYYLKRIINNHAFC